MEFGFTTAAYVVAAVLFILSLGGLSGQESAKRAVWYGIAGMALAVFATLIGPGAGLWVLSLILIALGGVIGYQLATKVQMTQMPELVAAMHSLVGLAAVFVGFIAHFEMARVAGLKAEGADLTTLGTFATLIAKKTTVELNILRVEVLQHWRVLSPVHHDAGRAFHRVSPDHGHRRRRHARRRLDAQQLLGLGSGGDRFQPWQ